MEEHLSKKDYIKALEKMKKSPRDVVGILGELGVTGIGVAGGIAASNSIATAFGATTLLGSKLLASLLGGVFVTTTPVGWVVGSAVAAGTLAFGTGHLIKSGIRSDTIKAMNIKKLEKRIANIQRKANSAKVSEDKFRQLIEALQLLIKNDLLEQAKSTAIIAGVQCGNISYDFAFKAVNDIIAASKLCTETHAMSTSIPA